MTRFRARARIAAAHSSRSRDLRGLPGRALLSGGRGQEPLERLDDFSAAGAVQRLGDLVPTLRADAAHTTPAPRQI